MEIRENAQKNQENSGRCIKKRLNSSYFITILRKNSGKLNFQLIPPFPGKHQLRQPCTQALFVESKEHGYEVAFGTLI
jgi:hypothetical protein